MQETVLKPGLDTFLFAVPFLGMLLVGFFRLDGWFAAPKQELKPRRPPSGMDEAGRPLLTDPDGRLWRPARGRR